MPRAHIPNQIDYIEFPLASSDQLSRAESFFTQVFGWKYKNWGEDYSDTADSGVGSGLNADPQQQPGRPLVVIYSDDLIAARERVIAAGGTIACEIFAFPGGRRFHFRAPDGTEMAVWSDK